MWNKYESFRKNIIKITAIEKKISKKSQSLSNLSSILSSTNGKNGQKKRNSSSHEIFLTLKNKFNKPNMSIIKRNSFLHKMNSSLEEADSRSNKNIFKCRNSVGEIKDKDKDKIKKYKKK